MPTKPLTLTPRSKQQGSTRGRGGRLTYM
ncbi:hypothetical protein GQ607_010536 [Colletotrichum asianum]|uniref:Uncharacterized protein n=1 Tax=Colletotrichum asianum TaxID=702518 RepID=A0A8H3WCP5_9PEZI|nr:hypothetical protein GQ607_010536 [Colletotrichum asianum]